MLILSRQDKSDNVTRYRVYVNQMKFVNILTHSNKIITNLN